MAQSKTAAIVLAAGLGTRMASDLPKVLHPLAGQPMITTLLESLSVLAPDRVVVVIGPAMEAVAEAVRPHATAIQAERLGTGHAALAAGAALKDFDGDILILFGDSPLIRADTLEEMLAARRRAPYPAVVVLGFRPWEPGAYGRLIRDQDGALEAIVEAADADPEQLQTELCNSGVMAVDGECLFGLLERLDAANAKGEYYLTDIVKLAREDDLACAVVEADEDETLGINSRAELALAESIIQDRLRARAMAGGATLQDPETVYFSFDTRVGRDVTIGPNVVFGPGVSVGDDVTIRAFCHIEGAKIAPGAIVGPFARLRPGADIGAQAHIGNFVEIKAAMVGDGAKINHLTYVGDAKIGAAANIGAGTITCNYDGATKSLTEIGKGAFIGSNTALVAPVKVGDGATTGAGSVITRDVAAGALAVTRPAQKEIKNWRQPGRQKTTKKSKPKS